MTLAEIIRAYEGRPIKTVRRTALTPKGQATVAARRLARLVAQLESPLDRLDVMALVTEEAVRLLRETGPEAA